MRTLFCLPRVRDSRLRASQGDACCPADAKSPRRQMRTELTWGPLESPQPCLVTAPPQAHTAWGRRRAGEAAALLRVYPSLAPVKQAVGTPRAARYCCWTAESAWASCRCGPTFSTITAVNFVIIMKAVGRVVS